nr:MAG TPA: hypothetical protein [Caudoviricetes sp.]
MKRMNATLNRLSKVLKTSFQDVKRLKSLSKTFESGWSMNLDCFRYQREEMI